MTNINEDLRKENLSLTAPLCAAMFASISEQLNKGPRLQLNLCLADITSDENGDKVTGFPCPGGVCSIIDENFKAKLAAKAKERAQAKSESGN